MGISLGTALAVTQGAPHNPDGDSISQAAASPSHDELRIHGARGDDDA